MGNRISKLDSRCKDPFTPIDSESETESKIFFDVYRSFFDLFACSLIFFFAYAPTFAWCPTLTDGWRNVSAVIGEFLDGLGRHVGDVVSVQLEDLVPGRHPRWVGESWTLHPDHVSRSVPVNREPKRIRPCSVQRSVLRRHQCHQNQCLKLVVGGRMHIEGDSWERAYIFKLMLHNGHFKGLSTPSKSVTDPIALKGKLGM